MSARDALTVIFVIGAVIGAALITPGLGLFVLCAGGLWVLRQTESAS